MIPIGNTNDPIYMVIGSSDKSFTKMLGEELKKNGLTKDNTVLVSYSKNILDDIKQFNPHYILLLGLIAMRYVLGSLDPIGGVRGTMQSILHVPVDSGVDPFKDKYNLFITNMVTFDPEYVISKQDEEIGPYVREMFNSDIKKFKELERFPVLFRKDTDARDRKKLCQN